MPKLLRILGIVLLVGMVLTVLLTVAFSLFYLRNWENLWVISGMSAAAIGALCIAGGLLYVGGQLSLLRQNQQGASPLPKYKKSPDRLVIGLGVIITILISLFASPWLLERHRQETHRDAFIQESVAMAESIRPMVVAALPVAPQLASLERIMRLANYLQLSLGSSTSALVFACSYLGQANLCNVEGSYEIERLRRSLDSNFTIYEQQHPVTVASVKGGSDHVYFAEWSKARKIVRDSFLVQYRLGDAEIQPFLFAVKPAIRLHLDSLIAGTMPTQEWVWREESLTLYFRRIASPQGVVLYMNRMVL